MYYNRYEIRFTKIDGDQYVSLSDVLNVARIQKPSDVLTITSIISNEYGFYPIEVIPVAKASSLVKQLKPNLKGLIEFLQSQIITEAKKAA